MSICEHCRYYKTKKLNGVIVVEYCKKYSSSNFTFGLHSFIKCNGWSRSLKSRLGLVKELKE